MSIDIRPEMGWDRVLVLANDDVELMVTLDVGPRIISYRQTGGPNLFMTFDDQLGHTDEMKWQSRGGHRLWIAPEAASTYFPDNGPVAVESRHEYHVHLSTPVEKDTGIAKAIDLILLPTGTSVEVNHSLTASQTLESAIAPWGLTVLRPGGKAIVPMPARKGHPNDLPPGTGDDLDLLPNRQLALWAYTDMNDPRFNWYEDRLEINQDVDMPSTKLGFLHQLHTAHYELDGYRFSKTIDHVAGANYPDGNCNLEIFTDKTMLELESLGPLVKPGKGEQIVHTEYWSLESL